MQFAYLGADAIFLTLWIWLFSRRADLRRLQLTMSLAMLPLAFMDFFFVPSYWQPVTLFNIPIGIEGLLFSFAIGGTASVLYALFRNQKLVRLAAVQRLPWTQATFVPALMATVFLAADAFGAPNPMVAAYLAFAIGISLVAYLRRDLALAIIWSGLLFGACYFICLRLWVTAFSGVHAWFVLQGLPKVFIWGVPGWEILFSFFYGALWSQLYPLIFNYRFAEQVKKHRV
jgi:hypothetical protein